MRINCLNGGNKPAFGRIIYYTDMHMHDKAHALLGKKANPEDLLSLFTVPVKNGSDEFVSKDVIVSALDSIFYEEKNDIRTPYASELEGNREILRAYKNTPIHNFYAVCQPQDTKGSTSAIETVLHEGGGKFVGLKFHPAQMRLAADSNLYDPYLELAKREKLPCLFHSDRTFDKIYDGTDGKKYTMTRCEFSRPDQIYALAKRHPDVPVIMGHMGGVEPEDAKAAIDVLTESIKNEDARLYADISWVDCNSKEKPNLIEAIRRLRNTSKGDRTDRLLFGTDAPLGRFGGTGEGGLSPQQAYAKTIVDVQTAIKNNFGDEADSIIDRIFYKNADELFFKNRTVQNAVQNVVNTAQTSTKRTLSKTQIGLIAFGAAAAVGVLGGILYNKYSKKDSQSKN